MSKPDSPTPAAPATSIPSAAPAGVLVRSEEQLHVTTRRVPARRARLEKYLVTETHTVTVQLTHEQVRLVYEPVPPDEPGSAGEDHDAGQRCMTLHREQVVVSTVVMPVERVRLEIFPVTAPQVVTKKIRREQIDTDTDTDTDLINQTNPARDTGQD